MEAASAAGSKLRCDETGLPRRTTARPDGTGVSDAPRNGATTTAIFDCDTPAMAQIYTKVTEKKAAGWRRDVLYQLSKRPPIVVRTGAVSRPLKFLPNFNGWQEWRGSNSQPPVLETGALPIELHS